jgi:O-methyltransferase domain
VIHDWDDARAVALLTRCQQAMRPRGKALLVERVILSGSAPSLLVLESDVNMLVATSGKERTDAEYRALLGAAGFELRQIIPVSPPYSLIEAVRV